jgi:hypothetical protein
MKLTLTFYEQLLRQNSSTKEIQSQTVTREKLQKTLSYQKVAHKMLVKLTPVIFTTFLWRIIERKKKTLENLTFFFSLFLNIHFYKLHLP